MVRALEKFLETMYAYGQDPTEIVFSDKPADEGAFFRAALPGVQAMQDQLNTASPTPPPPSTALPACSFFVDNSKVLKSTVQINEQVDAIRNLVKAYPPEQCVIALDAEWDTNKNQRGMVVGHEKVSVIQLGYMLSDRSTTPNCLILQVGSRKLLPDRLVALFADPAITFVGRMVGGDVKKIAKDFNQNLMRFTKILDLGKMARKRDVVQSGVVTLDRLVEVTLKECMWPTKRKM